VTIRVMIAEDQTMVRGALAALLALEEDIEVVAEASRGDEVVPAALDAVPDVALLDIEMPGGDGLSAAAALEESLPSCRVLILTTFGRAGYLRRAMESGALGFLLKDAPSSELAAAIRRVMAGERVVDPGLAVAALSEGESPLTERSRSSTRATAWRRRVSPSGRAGCRNEASLAMRRTTRVAIVPPRASAKRT
jgi:two-component system response regulator DesR